MSGSRNRARSKARRCAVQALYQWQLAGHPPADIIKEFVAERETEGADIEYFDRLVREIPRCAPELERRLGTVTDREWLRIDPVERAVLLVGAFELEHCPEIPWRVVVNESIELAKLFGAEQGHRYVNAALDRLARDLRAVEIAG
ncbi:MAG: transcription antitermination factor NusB [Gammaproteobacteria bacterium]